MKVLSFAQNREDVLLWRALHDVDPHTVCWIDIGAADPVTNSVTKWFSLQGWRGVNVEPVPSVHALLVEDRHLDVNVHAAVGASNGSMRFGVVHDNTELSTFDDALLNLYRAQGFVVSTVDVPVITIQRIFEDQQSGRTALAANLDCAFLKVDVEGHEAAALGSNDWDRYRPWIAMIEATTPTQWLPLMHSARYEQVLDDGLNFVFVSHEKREQYARVLSRPVSSLDDHQLYRYAVAPEERASRTFRWAVLHVAGALAGVASSAKGPTDLHAAVGPGCYELAHLFVSRIDLQRAFAGDGNINRNALLHWALNTSVSDDPEIALLESHYRELRALLT